MSVTGTWASRLRRGAIALEGMGIGACGGGAVDGPQSAGIPADSLSRWMDEARPFALLDVRPDSLFEAARIAGSIRAHGLDYASLRQVLPDRPEVPLVFVSEDGSRILGAPDRDAASAGHARVFWLAGGVQGWRAAGYPVVGSRDFAR